jgi:hypothetical protein
MKARMKSIGKKDKMSLMYDSLENNRSLEEILILQSKGKFLTNDEKKRILLYAEKKRKERLKK